MINALRIAGPWFAAGVALAFLVRAMPFDTLLTGPVVLSPIYFGGLALIFLIAGKLWNWPIACVPLGLGLGFGIAAILIFVFMGG